MFCSSCFNDFLVKCNTTITLFIGLAVLGVYDSYNWVITDKFGHKYSGVLTEDAPDVWSIDVADLPDGLLTQYSGDFRLEIFNAANIKQDFTIAQRTDCISFEIHAGNMVKDNLGVAF